MPNEISAIVRDSVSIPCYGIGAGLDLDGQLIIMHDILGTFIGDIRPKFIKVFDNIGEKDNQSNKPICK